LTGAGNDRKVKLTHFAAGSDFSPRLGAETGSNDRFSSNAPDADSERIPSRFDAGLRATTAWSNDETHISTSADKRRPRFTGPQNPVPTVDKSVGPTDLAHKGERPS
jgi:hypothetical protein